MRIFGGDRIGSIMKRLKVDDETPIENRVISKSLEAAQKKVEGFNFDPRKNVVQYDDVMNRHRKATYTMRQRNTVKLTLDKELMDFIEEEAKTLADSPDASVRPFESLITESISV